MTRTSHPPRRRGRRVALAIVATALVATILPSAASAADPDDTVLRWNAHAVAAIGNPGTATPPGLGQPPPVSSIHLAMVQAAVYDAVNAIDGGHEAYLDGLPSVSSSASKAAAAATAAHGVLVGLASAAPAVVASVDALLTASLAGIPDGPAKTAGIAIGQAAAAAMLAERTGDGRFGSRTFTPGDAPGEWVVVPPLNANVFGWVADVRPFALRSADQFRVEPPHPLTSLEYAVEFNEVKALGRQTGSSRTAAQTSLAGFVSANPLPLMNRGLREIAAAQGLDPAEQARFLAMTNVASADALISCWENKVHYNVWRPVTAIRAAATDGNPLTTADPDWTSLVPTPGYPDLPSGYNCLAAGMWHAARLFFGTDRMSFSLTSPGIVAAPPNTPVGVDGSTRHYTRFTGVVRDAIEGRMLNGLHFRHADVQGAWIGKKAAQWVAKHEFEPVD